MLVVAVLMTVSIILPLKKMGSEFMPPLYEGDLLYMPTTLPGISITKAKELLQQTDRIIAQFPEVEHVFGKVGRAETATDPAPLSMLETTIMLKPEDRVAKVPVQRFYTGWPELDRVAEEAAALAPGRRRTTITVDELTDQLNRPSSSPA